MDKRLATGAQVFLGFLLGILLNALISWAGFLLPALVLPFGKFTNGIATVQLYGLLFIGAVQLIWQIPLIVLLRKKGHKSLALGVILAVSITALLNATCWGLMWSGKIRIGG